MALQSLWYARERRRREHEEGPPPIVTRIQFACGSHLPLPTLAASPSHVQSS